jgi:hypothetical protein
VTEAVNHQLPAFYAYVRDRQQRRQDHIAALARAAGQQASNPVERVKAEDRTARAAVQEFDADEPELDFDAWRAVA